MGNHLRLGGGKDVCLCAGWEPGSTDSTEEANTGGLGKPYPER